MKIIADRSKCIGAGQCVVSAEEVFTQDEDDGLVIVLVAEPNETQRKDVELAVRSCPTQSLTLLED